jgi:predicted dehydrogenase
MPDTVRCAVIGAGGFAETCHIPGLQSHPNAEVVALCGRNLDNCRTMAERNHIPDAVSDYRKIMARDDIHAVAIVTPNVSHHPIALAAFEAGKHVFCEKPLAMNVREAREMEDAAQRAGLVGQVAFTFRFQHGIEAGKQAIREGKIGKPFFTRIRFEWGGDLRKGGTIGWRHLWEESGPGMLQDMGSHCLDLFNYTVEPVTELCGILANIPRTRLYGKTNEMREVTNDDLAGAYIRGASGLQGEFMVSRITTVRGGGSELEVMGEEGTIRITLSRGHADKVILERYGEETTELPLADEPNKGTDYALGRMMRAFVDGILGNPPTGPEATFTDGRIAQQGIEAVLRSVDERRWVRLDEV